MARRFSKRFASNLTGAVQISENRMIRLKDIAEKAGVSLMTVSKALRDSSDISLKTRERIRKLAAELRYVPDSMAAGLRTKRSNLFGVVVSSIADPIFARILFALNERSFD